MFSFNKQIIDGSNDSILISRAKSLEEYVSAFDLETSFRLNQIISIMKSIVSQIDVIAHSNGLTLREVSPFRPIAMIDVQQQWIEIFACPSSHFDRYIYYGKMDGLFGIINRLKAKYEDGIVYFYHNKKFPISLVKRVLEICNASTKN